MSQVFETYTFCAQKTDKSSVTEIRFTRWSESRERRREAMNDPQLAHRSAFSEVRDAGGEPPRSFARAADPGYVGKNDMRSVSRSQIRCSASEMTANRGWLLDTELLRHASATIAVYANLARRRERRWQERACC
jgi:hypothetical protein